jgi:hypothetical protein
VGFVVDEVALEQVFSEYFGFPCQFLFHRLLHIHHHYLSSGAGTIDQLVAAVSPHPKKLKENKLTGISMFYSGISGKNQLHVTIVEESAIIIEFPANRLVVLRFELLA